MPGCVVLITDGGRITAANGDRATFGGNAKVSEDGEASGQQEYRDHGPADPMRMYEAGYSITVFDSSEPTFRDWKD